MAEAAEAASTSLDAILDGRLRLRQPLYGHRVGADAVLLAAAAGAPASRLIDVGAGVGAVGLALLQRWPEARADLVEIDPALAALAGENAALNGLADRARTIVADALAPAARRAAGLVEGAADLVVVNPPFFAPGAARASPDAARARAHVARASAPGCSPLEAWVVASLALLAPGGRFVMIHRPDALPAILPALARRLGEIALRPVHPRAEEAAIRLIISGVKGSKAPLRILPGLTLHEASGAFTPLAAAIHRGEAFL
jgi:tRNA1(Val) A37 N6-methylase TrmN6